MECIGSKLQKQGVLILLSLVLINTGCEEKADNPVPDSLKGTPVNVDLSFGFNDEIDGASLCSQTDTTDGNDEAFSIQLVSGQSTRTGLDDMNTSKPVKLKLKWKSFSGDKSAEFDYCTRKSTPANKSGIGEERSVLNLK